MKLTTKEKLQLRNIQMANRQLRRAIQEIVDAKSDAEVREIVEDHQHIADWVTTAQANTTAPMSMWDEEPIQI